MPWLRPIRRPQGALWLAANGLYGRAAVLVIICAGVAGALEHFVRPVLLGESIAPLGAVSWTKPPLPEVGCIGVPMIGAVPDSRIWWI